MSSEMFSENLLIDIEENILRSFYLAKKVPTSAHKFCLILVI